jgi:hypothetical protein
LVDLETFPFALKRGFSFDHFARAAVFQYSSCLIYSGCGQRFTFSPSPSKKNLKADGRRLRRRFVPELRRFAAFRFNADPVKDRTSPDRRRDSRRVNSVTPFGMRYRPAPPVSAHTRPALPCTRRVKEFVFFTPTQSTLIKLQRLNHRMKICPAPDTTPEAAPLARLVTDLRSKSHVG